MIGSAVIQGGVLELAKIIEKTYGKGSFKKLGEETKFKK